MIVADRKPYEEIVKLLADAKRILVAGCGTCVSVCSTGGEKEVGILAEELRITSQKEGRNWEVAEATVERQCETEFLTPLKDQVEKADAVLSMACGAGIQLLAAQYKDRRVLPAVNTTFLGTNTAPGKWDEYCRGCGDCVLAETGGICPVARCSKSLVNGTCGGTKKGMCEVDPVNTPCGWFMIYERLRDTGRLDRYRVMRNPRNWALAGGAPRRLSREELTKLDTEPAPEKKETK